MFRLLHRLTRVANRVLGRRVTPPPETPEARQLLSLQRQVEQRGAVSSLQLPWGELECVEAGTIPPQFQDIFVNRRYALRQPPSPMRILDCGGNVGLSGIWFGLHYTKAEVVVLEASLQLAEIARRNLRRAGVTNVTVRHAAVWESNGTVSFLSAGDDKGKVVSQGAAGGVTSVDIAEAVLPHTHLLKMDIEGAEFVCLRRLLASGAIRHVDNLVVELHMDCRNCSEFSFLLDHLASAGFRLNFESDFGPWLGSSSEPSAFSRVGELRMFVHLYASRRSSSR